MLLQQDFDEIFPRAFRDTLGWFFIFIWSDHMKIVMLL